LAKKRNGELQTEHDAIFAANQKLVKRADELFGAKIEAAGKRLHEIEAETQHAKVECIELEEKIRY